MERICLFCKANGDFSTVEHIVPKSLGNDTDILEGVICDRCQNYLGAHVEKPALEKTPVAFWRSYLGIRTRKEQLPSTQLDSPAKGAIPFCHPLTDIGVGFTAHENGSTSIDINSSDFMRKLVSQDTSQYRLVLSPWHLSILGRFLGKMGLEFVARVNLDYALTSEFDPIRSFVRCGSTRYIWPIYWGQQRKLSDLKGPVVWEGQEGHQEIECYRYALGETINGECLFAFSIGLDLTLLCLTHRFPSEALKNSIQGVKLSCIYYEEGTW